MSSHLLLGHAPSFLNAVELIERVAGYDVSVVIEGETGTGKELAARTIHYGSERRNRPFVPVNCGAIPDTLIERELFGHERGAFTDARAAAPGLIEVADGGTLFLDEVDALSPRAQVTLLRFLQDQSYRPLGSHALRRCNVRTLAASNRNLDALAARGEFRSDLLFRLKVMTVVLPPLRMRHGDVALLARHFIATFNSRYGKHDKHVGPALAAWLEAQPWPGNVRELENFVHRLYLLSDGPELEPPPGDVPAPALAVALGVPDTQTWDYRAARAAALEAFDLRFLETLLRHTRGNVTAAARVARKERRALGKLLRKYGLEPDAFRVC